MLHLVKFIGKKNLEIKFNINRLFTIHISKNNNKGGKRNILIKKLCCK